MTLRKYTSTYISLLDNKYSFIMNLLCKSLSERTSRGSVIGIAIIFMMLFSIMPVSAQDSRDARKMVETLSEDSIPLFRGIAVGIDLVGPVMVMLSDYGTYEAMAKVNLKDKYFPTIELGLGVSDHTDDATNIHYKTSAPFGRIGLDYNILKNKHDDYRAYVGGRYAFSSFKYDVKTPGLEDPYYGGDASYEVMGSKATYHWAEFLFGVDAKIVGPVHFGWSVRYKRRIAHSYSDGLGKAWYVPGFGKDESVNWGAAFHVGIDL